MLLLIIEKRALFRSNQMASFGCRLPGQGKLPLANC